MIRADSRCCRISSLRIRIRSWQVATFGTNLVFRPTRFHDCPFSFIGPSWLLGSAEDPVWFDTTMSLRFLLNFVGLWFCFLSLPLNPYMVSHSRHFLLYCRHVLLFLFKKSYHYKNTDIFIRALQANTVLQINDMIMFSSSPSAFCNSHRDHQIAIKQLSLLLVI